MVTLWTCLVISTQLQSFPSHWQSLWLYTYNKLWNTQEGPKIYRNILLKGKELMLWLLHFFFFFFSFFFFFNFFFKFYFIFKLYITVLVLPNMRAIWLRHLSPHWSPGLIRLIWLARWVSPSSLTAPCASLPKLRTRSKRTTIPARGGLVFGQGYTSSCAPLLECVPF